MLNDILATFTQFMHSVESNVQLFTTWVGLLFGIHVLNMCLGRRLCVLGIHPRSLFGIPGIVFTVFLHVDFGHVFMNSILLVILGNLLAMGGLIKLMTIAVYSTILGGGLVWLLGRPMIHVGASGLVMGLCGALCIQAYEQQTIYAWFLAGLMFYFFEHIAANLVPGEAGTSWEGHLFGFIAGGIAEHFQWTLDPFMKGIV